MDNIAHTSQSTYLLQRAIAPAVRAIWKSPILFISILLCLLFSQLPHMAQAQASAPPLQLHHVTLFVNDVDRVSNWYAETLGFEQTDRFTLTRADGGQIEVSRVEIPGFRMNISRYDTAVAPDRSRIYQGWRHVAFEVEDVDRRYQMLQSQGVDFLAEPYTFEPPGYRVAFLRDPEDNVIELYQELS